MKHVFVTATALALVASLGACKQNAATETAATTEASTGTGIDGTWVVDLASAKFAGKPLDLTINNGTYTCASCSPPLTVAADGAFHPVTGRDYADAISVKIDSPTQVTVASKKGDLALGSTVWVVSADGKTLTNSYTDTSVKGAAPVTGSNIFSRVGEAPAGAHAASGKWQINKVDKMSDGGTTLTYASTADTLKMTSPDGTSYEAKTDGTDTPLVGDPAGTMISVTKTGDNAWHIVSKIKGKEVSSADLALDGDTIHATSTNIKTGDKTTYDLKRK
jgi:hypothetical protein